MEDEDDYCLKGRQGIRPDQIQSLMGFNEDAASRAPPGGAHTIVTTRLAALTTMFEHTQAQINDLHSKMFTFFQYVYDRDEDIQLYFLELLPEENPVFPQFPEQLFQPSEPELKEPQQDQPALPSAKPKKTAASTSKATPISTLAPAPTKVPPSAHPQSTPTPIPHATAPASASLAKPPTSSKRTISRRDKRKAPIKPTPPTTMPKETIALDSDDDEDMLDALAYPESTFDTSVL
ncbi:hypothetical protein V6N11_058515 [Hibiscus sabdariffa]|uniref:Uncharacterized protein n=1 Tax=Hibiscus sabdariffa TaxID=183260 RepID=A0ABR2U4S2_9ROSI